MDKEQLVWEHFKLNAEQRLKGFNFYISLSIFIIGGALTIWSNTPNNQVQIWAGASVAILAVIFFLIDNRSKQLLSLSTAALKELEADYPKSFRLFKNDDEQRSVFVKFTVAFRLLMGIQFIVGIVLVTLGLCPI